MKKIRNPVVRAARSLKAGVHQKSKKQQRQTLKCTLKTWEDVKDSQPLYEKNKKKIS